MRTRAEPSRPAAPAPAETGGGAYAQPEYYDIIHERGTGGEVDAMVRIARSIFARPSLRARDAVWLEPCCGTGRYLRALAARGAPCVGFDLDRGMVAAARRSLRRAGDGGEALALGGDMRRCDDPSILRGLRRLAGREHAGPLIIFNPHNSVRHLSSDDDMLAHLSSVRRVLESWPGVRGRAGSAYLVGIGLVGEPGRSAWGEQSCETVYTETRGDVRVREIIDFVMPDQDARGEDARTEIAYKHLSVFVRPRGSRRFPIEPTKELISSYTLRTYTLSQWRTLVKRAGLIETGVIGAWGERLNASRLHYAWRVLQCP